MKEKSDQLKVIIEKFLMDICEIIYSAHLEEMGKIEYKVGDICDECNKGKLEYCCDNPDCTDFRC